MSDEKRNWGGRKRRSLEGATVVVSHMDNTLYSGLKLLAAARNQTIRTLLESAVAEFLERNPVEAELQKIVR